MKAQLLKILVLIIVMSFVKTAISSAEEKKISRREARTIVEATKEVAGLYALDQGRYVDCIEISVKKTCETDWVTCIEDAWVVEFKLGDVCNVKHDGRISVTMLVDATDGSIVSRFPEVEYFEDKTYCLIDKDCFCIESEQKSGNCLNFIYGQLYINDAKDDCVNCRCIDKQCQLIEVP